MNQKQYADMTTIMQFGRIFADQIKKCLENSGLAKKGFGFELRVDKNYDDSGYHCKVSLDESITTVGKDRWEETAMEQWRWNDEGWRVEYDPLAEAGDLPTEVRIRETNRPEENDRRANAKAEKPYPPDGLWLSAYR